jgi:N6-L-threonylcarbamoyladenine synthase
VVAGGVARNAVLRTTIHRLAEEEGIVAFFPPMNLCTDNGVMVAWNGIEILKR